MPTLMGEQLEAIAFHLFCAAGAPESHSRIVAQHLMENNLMGHDSHGFIRIIQYIRQIREGIIIPSAKPEMVSEFPSGAQVDGHHGFGQVAAQFFTKLAIEKAQQQGVSCVTVRNLCHMGRLGAYVEMAARAGCAAILYSSTGGYTPAQAPFGAARRKLATNPIAMALPAEREGVIVSDFATSVAAEGKLRVLRARRQKVPDGWLLDKDGRPSNDPNAYYEGGAILPLGGSVGHKGYCLAFMTELFSALLSRGGFVGSPGKQFSNNSFMVAIQIDRFAPLSAVKSEASKMVESVKDTPLAEGFSSILYPGEKEAMTQRERKAKGVEIEDETWNQVMALVKEYGVENRLKEFL